MWSDPHSQEQILFKFASYFWRVVNENVYNVLPMLMLPNKSMCIICRLHMELCRTYEVCNYAYFIVFEWYFALLSCPCLIYYSHIVYNYNIFHPLWDQYTDSIVNPLHMCLFGAVSDNLSSQISQWIICHILSVHDVVTYANHTFGGPWLIINWTDIWHKIRFDGATGNYDCKNDGLVETFVAGISSWGMEHISDN